MVGSTGIVGSVIGTTQSFHRCRVQIAGEARRLIHDHFVSAYDRSKTFRKAVNAHNMSMWALSQQAAACNASHQMQSRMARLLLEVRDLIQSPDLPLRQESVAMMLGVQRTSVASEERKLKAARLIQIRRGGVVILDVDGLRAKACKCYEANRGHRSLSVPVH